MNRKICIVPCSGIGKTYGSVAREGAFIVTEDLRPETTRIMALSRLVPDDSDVRVEIALAESITIDGCKLACAAKVVAETGGTVAHALQVLDVYRKHRDLKPAGIAELNEGGKRLAAVLAEEVAALVDNMEGKHDA
ncbi:MAG TPA: putative zinc-binding protein [Acidobacteriota bacterium]|nr:putative zinc-binding protein [Acidobacteriota bacterium]